MSRQLTAYARATWKVSVTALLVALTVGAATAQARTVKVNERASLHLVKKSGSTIYQAGTATGTLPGTITSRFNVSITRVTGSFKITTRGGTLTMSVNGSPRSAGTVARFAGTMRVVGGTGRFSRARGSGSFSGTVNRRTWAASVTASGRLTY